MSVSRLCIWTGDTTTHGGTLNEGHPNMTYNNQHRAVLRGHKFWCPQCHCWSTFVEGSHRVICHGQPRVLEGHRASCGAYAIHRLGIQDTVDDEMDTSRGRERQSKIDLHNAAQVNQGSGYSHSFVLHNDTEKPVGYIVFQNQTLLDIGTAGKNVYGGGVTAKVSTSQAEKIHIAVQASRPLLK